MYCDIRDNIDGKYICTLELENLPRTNEYVVLPHDVLAMVKFLVHDGKSNLNEIVNTLYVETRIIDIRRCRHVSNGNT